MLISIENIPSDKIDKNKWNNCVNAAENGFIYATTDYLNTMCNNWNGIVVNDYEAVMPLPWRKKFGIKYTYDVPFIQQLGWIGNMDAKLVKQFVSLLFSFCKYGDYTFNYANNISAHSENSRMCNNFVIDLSLSYKVIKSNYTADFNYNLRKAAKEIVEYKTASVDEAIMLYKNLYGNRMSNVKETDFINFKTFCNKLAAIHSVIVRSVSNMQNEVLAISLLLMDGKRIYNILNSITSKGRKTKANYFLFASVLQEFSGTNLIFDFEGSDIPGVKRFYQKFGAINQPYCRLHFNNLPLPLCLFKR